MASPISGDKILTQRDMNPTRTEPNTRRGQDAESSETPSRAPVAQDSVELGFQQSAARPLSDNVSSPAEAQNTLSQLLDALRANPAAGLSAQASIGQNQADALLSRPA